MDTLDFLIEQFPACFDLDNPRPLKVGMRAKPAAEIKS
jgi:hypothetical protein